MKKFLIILIVGMIIFSSCIQETVNPDYVALVFPQDKENEQYKEYMNKVFYPGIYKFPNNFFNELLESGDTRKLIEYQIDDNIDIRYINPDPRDQKDHRLAFKDGTKMTCDFKGVWELKHEKKSEEGKPKIVVYVLEQVNFKLEPTSKIGNMNRYTMESLYHEYAYDLVSWIIRQRFEEIESYFDFIEMDYDSLYEELIGKINNQLGYDCPITLKRLFISNKDPEEITKGSLVLQTAIDREIELINKIGPVLKMYPGVIEYLNLKFAENNNDKIETYIFNAPR